MNLREAFDRNQADKGYKHRYEEIYEPFFEPVRNEPINILEIGVWKGAGMAALHDYFPNANLYGIDIFTRIRPEEVDVLKRDRVVCYEGDSTAKSSTKHFDGIEFDFIIDDGAHWPKANLQTFINFAPLLKKTGVYFVEDVWPIERMTTDELKHPWLHRYPERYSQLENNLFLNTLLNSGMEIKRHDNRKKTKQPDSYIISLKRHDE